MLFYYNYYPIFHALFFFAAPCHRTSNHSTSIVWHMLQLVANEQKKKILWHSIFPKGPILNPDLLSTTTTYLQQSATAARFSPTAPPLCASALEFLYPLPPPLGFSHLLVAFRHWARHLCLEPRPSSPPRQCTDTDTVPRGISPSPLTSSPNYNPSVGRRRAQGHRAVGQWGAQPSAAADLAAVRA